MDRWHGKVAVVTGASAGIGAACVKDLLNAGLIVVGLARREERMQELRNSLAKNLQSHFHPIKCDICNENDVKNAFSRIDLELGGADILINNAGIVRAGDLVEPNNTEMLREVIDTNIMGVAYCTREAFNSMKLRNVKNGHIVIINSLAGHRVPNFGKQFPSFNIYAPTKHAITAMIEVYRQEFQKHNTNVKISSISPGAVATEIFPEGVENLIKSQMQTLKSEDVSNAVMFALATPPHVQIQEIMMRSVDQSF